MQLRLDPTKSPIRADLTLPGSKSLTNRALLAAGLAGGVSTLEGALFSEDSRIFAAALRALGIDVAEDEAAATFTIHGQGGRVPGKAAEIFLANAGTAARFLPPMLMLGGGRYALDGVEAMRARPMSELFDLLQSWGARITYGGTPGCYPATIEGGALPGGKVKLAAERTSQQLSGVLLISPYAAKDSEVEIEGGLVSPSYIAMTLALMADWGVRAEARGDGKFFIPAGQVYRAQRYAIEPDASSASYFFAAAAITQGDVTIRHLSARSHQGDVKFCDVLEAMGCTVDRASDHIRVRGPAQLRGGEFDMNDISDTAPTLAAIAPFASSPVTIRNVEHMRWKETDRVAAVSNELRRMGIQLEERRDGLTIQPGQPKPATIETYKDHRMAMSFAVTALRADGIVIDDPECVGKTFPDFFTRRAALLAA
jgi:3-phosphoshikimate 1-carboxyvinyltransferase